MDKITYDDKSVWTRAADWFLTPARVALGGRVITHREDTYTVTEEKSHNLATRIICGIAAFTVLIIPTAIALVAKKADKADVQQQAAADLAVFEQNGGKLRVGNEMDRAPFRIPTDPATALQRHVSYFGDEHGAISTTSTARAFMRQGFSRERAESSAAKILGVLGTQIHGCPFHALDGSTIHNGIHPMDSGFYHKDGTVNEAAWEQVKSWDQTGSGALNRVEIDQMLENNKRRDVNRGGNALWAVGSRTEWELALELFADRTEVVDGEGTPAISFGTLRRFLVEGDELFREREQRLQNA